MSDYRTWDQMSVVEQLQSMYSDFHKDVYGFRPRGIATEEWNSEEFLRKALAALEDTSKAVFAAEAEAEQAAIAEFEKRIAATIAVGAADRKTAIAWLLDAEEDTYVKADPDYFCYQYNLPYGYLSKDV